MNLFFQLLNQSKSFKGKRNLFIALNVIMYILQGVFLVLIYIFPHYLPQTINLSVIENLFFACLSIVVAVLFLYFGGSLFFMLKSYPIESNELYNKLFEVGSVTTISATSFIIRGILLFVTSFMLELDNNAYVLLSYYLSVEIIPTILVLLVLSKLPSENRKISTTNSKTDASVHGSGRTEHDSIPFSDSGNFTH